MGIKKCVFLVILSVFFLFGLQVNVSGAPYVFDKTSITSAVDLLNELDIYSQILADNGISASVEGVFYANPNNDILAELFEVFRESINEKNEDLEYLMSKMAYMQEIAEATGDYLQELNESMISGGQSDDEEDDIDWTVIKEDTKNTLIALNNLAEYYSPDPIPVLIDGDTVDSGTVGNVNAYMLINDIGFQFQLPSTTQSVPEPSTLLLLGTGLVGLVGFRWKFRV